MWHLSRLQNNNETRHVSQDSTIGVHYDGNFVLIIKQKDYFIHSLVGISWNDISPWSGWFHYQDTADIYHPTCNIIFHQYITLVLCRRPSSLCCGENSRFIIAIWLFISIGRGLSNCGANCTSALLSAIFQGYHVFALLIFHGAN